MVTPMFSTSYEDLVLELAAIERAAWRRATAKAAATHRGELFKEEGTMDARLSPSAVRQEWLEEAVAAMRPMFESVGLKVPAKVRISVGWPKGARDGKKPIGQCWAIEASADAHNEIFISPELGHQGKGSRTGSMQILGVIAHELVHAVCGNKAGHGPVFKAAANKIGLCGKMTSTEEGPEFQAWARPWLDEHGTFPAGALVAVDRKKQTTRLLKAECGASGYNVRLTRKWIEEFGTPLCPCCKISMSCEVVEEEEGE